MPCPTFYEMAATKFIMIGLEYVIDFVLSDASAYVHIGPCVEEVTTNPGETCITLYNQFTLFWC